MHESALENEEGSKNLEREAVPEADNSSPPYFQGGVAPQVTGWLLRFSPSHCNRSTPPLHKDARERPRK